MRIRLDAGCSKEELTWVCTLSQDSSISYKVSIKQVCFW